MLSVSGEAKRDNSSLFGDERNISCSVVSKASLFAFDSCLRRARCLSLFLYLHFSFVCFLEVFAFLIVSPNSTNHNLSWNAELASAESEHSLREHSLRAHV